MYKKQNKTKKTRKFDDHDTILGTILGEMCLRNGVPIVPGREEMVLKY